jgi:hypothetical protein
VIHEALDGFYVLGRAVLKSLEQLPQLQAVKVGRAGGWVEVEIETQYRVLRTISNQCL